MLIAAALFVAQAALCTAMDAKLPATLAVWTTPGHGYPSDLTRPVVLQSIRPEELGKPVDPANPPEPALTGGAARISFRIETAGIYGIALDQGGWIDVAPKDGETLKSVKHGHGPECSTIRKIVRFELAPGAYTLMLTKLTKPQVKGDARPRLVVLAHAGDVEREGKGGGVVHLVAATAAAEAILVEIPHFAAHLVCDRD